MTKPAPFLWAFLASLLFACHSPYVNHPKDAYARTLQYPVYIDKAFSDQDKKEIKAALSVWNDTLNGYQRFYVQDESWSPNMIEEQGTYVILNDREGFKFVKIEPNGSEQGILGWVDDFGDETVHLIPERCRSYGADDGLKIVAMHEIGHSLGIPHNGVEGSLLYPYYTHQLPNDSSCIDYFTALSLSKNNERFKLEHLNYCNMQ